MGRRMGTGTWLAILVALALVVGACGAPAKPAAEAPRPPVPTAAAAAASGRADAVTKPAAAAPSAAGAEQEAVQPAAAQPGTSGQSTAGDAYATNAATDRPWDRMIIRNATLALQVENVERALAQVRQIASKGGGFVSASTTRLEKIGDQERTIANVTIQVRAQAFDQSVQDLRGLALKVDSESGTSQDVTEEYVDLEANLRNLQATEASIVKLMERAQKLEDVLMLQRELTNVRSQIERIQGRKRFLENRADMSQISVSLQQPPVAITPMPTPFGKAWDPAATASIGWEASLRLLRGIADALILVVAFGWWLVPFVAAAVFAYARRGSARPTAPPTPTDA